MGAEGEVRPTDAVFLAQGPVRVDLALERQEEGGCRRRSRRAALCVNAVETGLATVSSVDSVRRRGRERCAHDVCRWFGSPA